MKNIKKYKFLIATLILGIIVAVFNSYLLSIDYVVNIRKGLDIHVQHSFYMDYLRENLYYSGDILPDLGMNFGMMQNYATLYYYGVFNIFIRAFALFPMLDAYQYQFVVNILVYMIVFYLMCRLLKYLEFEFKYIILGSSLATLAPALTWFFSNHTVFGYPYVFFILSLIGLAKLVKEDKIFLFTISNVLIITANLFQLQTTGLFALVFYVFYVLYLGADKEMIKKTLFKVFISYILALGISALIIIPQVYLYLSGSRYTLNEAKLDNLINFYNLKGFITNYFTFGFGFLSAALLAVFAYTKKKFIIVPTLMLILIFFSIDIAYIFNLFALEAKVFLYSAPVVAILILHMLKEVSKYEFKTKVWITGISSLLYFIVAVVSDYGREFHFSTSYYDQEPLNVFDTRKTVYIIMTVTLYLIFIFFVFELKKVKRNFAFGLLMLSYVSTTLVYTAIVSDINAINNYKVNYNIINDSDDQLSIYRDNDPTTTEGLDFDITRNVIYNYTSFVNPYYHDYFNEYIDIPMAHGGIAFNSFRTSGIIDRVLSVDGEDTTKPIIYGSYNVLDFDEWMNIERSLRITASLQGPAVEHDSNANYIPIDIFDEVTLVGEYDSYTLPGFTKEVFEEFNEQSGEYIVVANVETKEKVIMYVNNKKNEKTVNSSRFYNGNDVFTFYILADGMGIEIYNGTEETKLTDVKIYHISEDAINSYENDYIHPDNFVVDYNNGFNFDITMQQDGVLATTIPFDEGYKILVDGKEVNVELIDGSFIGAELSEGTHQVEIIYTTPGKNLGIIISIGSILVFIYLLKKRGF